MENEFFDASEVRQAITSQIESIIKDLFPEGRKKGADYRVGSVDGEKGESLSISCSGEGFGKWQDFSTGESGDIIDLVKLTQSINYRGALGYLAKKYTNLRPAAKFLKDARIQKTTKVEAAKYATDLSEGVAAYALGRGISRETMKLYKVLSTSSDPENEVAFVSTNKNGDPTRIHMVKVGTKQFRSNPDPMSPLWGTYTATPDACNGVLIITEGQWDALSYGQINLLATSIPSGVSNMKWIEEEYEYLQQFHTFLLSFDMDEKGEEAYEVAIKRLGVHKCKKITLPLKDANEVLTKLGGEVLAQAVADAAPCDLSEIATVNSVREETWNILSNDPDKMGDPFFISDLKYRIRPHECTIFFGHTGHGKDLSLSTLITCVGGQKEMKDVHKGDYVISPSGSPVKVIDESVVWTDQDCWEITFDDATKVVAGGNHLWEVETNAYRLSQSAQKRSKAKRTKLKYNQQHKLIPLQIINTRDMVDKVMVSGRTNYSIPLTKPIEGTASPLLDPYLLGVWLADGNTTAGIITKAESDIHVINRVKESGLTVTSHKKEGRWGVLGLVTKLKELNLYDNKHIPNWALTMSVSERFNLLQGLMDTDGSAYKSGQCEYCSMVKVLAENVAQLACSLGIKAKVKTGETTLNGVSMGTKYRVLFTTDLPVFSLPRKLERLNANPRPNVKRRFITSIERVETVPTKCIQVEGGMFLCTEAHIPTHNSSVVQNQIAYDAMNGRSTMIGSFEQKISFTLAAIAKAYSNTGQFVSRTHYNEVMDALNENVMFFDNKYGKPKAKDLISAFIYAFKRYGVMRYVIDNLMTMDVDRQDNKNQAENADSLRLFVEEYPINLALVAHPRKNPEQGYPKPPHEADIMGASEWGNMAQNIITVWRNKQKEDTISAMIDNNENPDEIRLTMRNSEDARVMIRKQRATGSTDNRKQWFKSDSKRYVSHYDDNGEFEIEQE